MSNRTIMEFNHDLADAIFNRPTEFVGLINAVMRGCDRDAMEELRLRFGVTVGRTRHHSEAMKPDVLEAFGGREP